MIISSRFINNGNSAYKLSSIQLESKKRIEEKIKKELFRKEKIECIICGTIDFELISKKDRYGFEFPVVICKECGLIQANPRLGRDFYDYFYNNEYSKLYAPNISLDRYFNDQEKRGARIFDFIEPISGIKLNNKKVLEIGCGTGGVLSYFQKKNNEVFGIDLDKEKILHAVQKHNLI